VAPAIPGAGPGGGGLANWEGNWQGTVSIQVSEWELYSSSTLSFSGAGLQPDAGAGSRKRPGGGSCICNVELAVATPIGWSLDSKGGRHGQARCPRDDLVLSFPSVIPYAQSGLCDLKRSTSLTMAGVHRALRGHKSRA
jgi:hypothetical protein